MAGLRTRTYRRQPTGQPDANLACSLLAGATGLWCLRPGAMNLLTGELTVLSGTASWKENLQGRGVRTNLGSNRLQLAADSSKVLPTSGGFTAFMHYRKLGSAAACAGWGVDASVSALYRCGTHQPYSDAKVYFDFGGNTEDSTRESTGALSFGDDYWVFTSGARGMEIWRNGALITSNSANPTRLGTSNPLLIGMHGTATQADDAESSQFGLLARQWGLDEIRAYFRTPNQVYEPRRRVFLGPPAGSGTDLTVADATHAHAADNVTLTQLHNLTTADATHAHLADGLTLTQQHVLTVADAAHAHLADNVTLTQQHILALADALHAHAAESVVLTVEGTLSVADALHSHLADNLTLAAGATLDIANALHAHAADNATLTQVHVLVVADALHAHLASTLSLSAPGAMYLSADRILVVRGEGRTLVVLPESRVLRVPADRRILH